MRRLGCCCKAAIDWRADPAHFVDPCIYSIALHCTQPCTHRNSAAYESLQHNVH